MVGYGQGLGGAPYGLQGEIALIPFDATVSRNDNETVSIQLSTELVKYPVFVERELTLEADTPETRSLRNHHEPGEHRS